MLWQHEILPACASTQDLMKARASQGADEGLVIQALTQSGGYGQRGRTWVGLDGNLFLSFLLKPRCSAQKAGELALLTGEVVASVLRAYIKQPGLVTIKLPNDVLIDGQKCAGVLVETDMSQSGQIHWGCVGLGLNLKAAPDGPFTSLAAHCDQPPDLQTLTQEFLTEMGAAYCRWQS